MPLRHNMLLPALSETIGAIDVNLISEDRKEILKSLADYILRKRAESKAVRLKFICSYNSRRSHLAQIWAHTMAFNFQISPVDCYSAGTEVTAMYPAIAFTLQESGFELAKLTACENPVYMFKFSANEAPIIAFSKSLEHNFNPNTGYAAIMVCSEADKACPNIEGAEALFAIPFSDPKEYDNTPLRKEKYLERSMQIAREFYYVFSEVKDKETKRPG